MWFFFFFVFCGASSTSLAHHSRTVKLENIISAMKNHTPTSDFLLDSLPAAESPAIKDPTASRRDRPRAAASEKGKWLLQAFAVVPGAGVELRDGDCVKIGEATSILAKSETGMLFFKW